MWDRLEAIAKAKRYSRNEVIERALGLYLRLFRV
jgi:predicted transcriptional regulator